MKNKNLFNIIRIGYIQFIIFIFIIFSLTSIISATYNFSQGTKHYTEIKNCLYESLPVKAIKTTSINAVPVTAFANQNVYAKIISENVYIYSQPVNNDFYKLFCVPRSYFVLLSDNAGDAQNLFYKAKYLDISGYIKKADVMPVTGTPASPYAQATIKTFAPNGLELRSSPSVLTQENIIITVPFLEEDLTYYGKAVGEIMVPTLGNIWYYCKYSVGSSVYYQGYLYSALCFGLSTIPENEENLPEFQGELFPTETDVPPADNEIKLSEELKIIIIICACLPCLFIIYLLFKPTKLIVDNGPNPKKKMKRLKKSEYYEYDE